jgi:hypothetical protein
LVDLPLAARLISQSKDRNTNIVHRRNKVLSTKVPLDLHNRFSLLAEYLFERGLSDTFTPSALLRDIIKYLLSGYYDVLMAYEMENYDQNSLTDSCQITQTLDTVDLSEKASN